MDQSEPMISSSIDEAGDSGAAVAVVTATDFVVWVLIFVLSAYLVMRECRRGRRSRPQRAKHD
ncbi:hypothetical protein DIPPA_28638 [Diplonema papillatum]|nr:hypothetical protein DIPPA_02189 [Diplonema papillatum]KAJ9445911.1 hypothetical protein DIPPA_28638 [Diplonema papillatum]